MPIPKPLPTEYLSDAQTTAQTNTVLLEAGAAPNRIAVKSISFSSDGATTFSLYSEDANLKWRVVLGGADHFEIDSYGEAGRYLFICLPGEHLSYSTTGTNNTFVAVNADLI